VSLERELLVRKSASRMVFEAELAPEQAGVGRVSKARANLAIASRMAVEHSPLPLERTAACSEEICHRVAGRACSQPLAVFRSDTAAVDVESTGRRTACSCNALPADGTVA
jgi:hypothetical protein